MNTLLSRIESPRDLQGLTDAQLTQLTQEIRDELSLARPYYLPHLKPPPDWTSFRTEYGPDRLPATFVRDEHPDTVSAIQAAFESGELGRHASGVNNVQRVPWRINEFMLPVVEKLACDVERRFKTVAGDDAECLRTAPLSPEDPDARLALLLGDGLRVRA